MREALHAKALQFDLSKKTSRAGDGAAGKPNVEFSSGATMAVVQMFITASRRIQTSDLSLEAFGFPTDGKPPPVGG